MSLWGWLFSALGALSLAWVFSKLSRWQPGQGGPYFYTRVGIGEFPAFLVAWGYWISIWTGNAAIAVAAVSYCKLIFPQLAASNTLSLIVALVFIWTFSLVNIRGVREAGIVQLVTTLLKAIPLILFALFGLFSIDTQHFQVESAPQNSASLTIISAAALWLWAFLGVESACIPADNIDKPEKNIPRATIIGVFIVAIVYLLGFIVVYGVIHPEQLSNSYGPFAEAAEILWGGWAGKLMVLVALVSTLGALNGLILLGGQMPLAAARDGLFPHWFAQQNSRQSPYLGILISSVLTTLLVFANSSEKLLSVFNFSILLSTTSILVAYLFCSASAFRLLNRRKEKFKSLSLIIFIISFLFSLWAVAGAGKDAVYWGFILMMAGVPVYTLIKISIEKKIDNNSENTSD